jgi:hypothetical protein
MKRLFFRVVVLGIAFFCWLPAEAFEVCCYQDGSELFVYKIGKETKKLYRGRKVANKKSETNHPMVNELLSVPGVVFVSVGSGSVTLVEDGAMEKREIRRRVAKIFAMYYPIGRVSIKEMLHP